tara:strand:+ start:690 stop:908 length:219 start_codon:yes stop_codon:yes gene_type:complete
MGFKMAGFSAFTKNGDDKKVVQDIESSIPKQIEDVKKDIITLEKRNKPGDDQLIIRLKNDIKRLQSKLKKNK